MSVHNERGPQGTGVTEIQDKSMKKRLRMQFAAQFVFIAQWK